MEERRLRWAPRVQAVDPALAHEGAPAVVVLGRHGCGFPCSAQIGIGATVPLERLGEVDELPLPDYGAGARSQEGHRPAGARQAVEALPARTHCFHHRGSCHLARPVRFLPRA
eukprot:102465-Lingulodinium_polyedra.AAC.1